MRDKKKTKFQLLCMTENYEYSHPRSDWILFERSALRMSYWAASPISFI